MATYSELFGHPPRFDERDAALLAERQQARNALSARFPHPCVGDAVTFADGKTGFVSYLWDIESEPADTWGVQTSRGGSFYLCEGGGMSFSGGLDPSIPRAKFHEDGTRTMRAWFFHHNISGAGRGVYFDVTVRHWRVEG